MYYNQKIFGEFIWCSSLLHFGLKVNPSKHCINKIHDSKGEQEGKNSRQNMT